MASASTLVISELQELMDTQRKVATLPAKLSDDSVMQKQESNPSGNNSPSKENKGRGSLFSAVQLFSKTSKPIDAGSDDSHSETDRADAVRVLGKVAAVPGLLADRVKSTQAKQIEAGELINLTFLEDYERIAIQKVIQADLKLRRHILGSLKNSIDKTSQSEPKETIEEKKSGPMPCTNCGKEINLICTRLLSGKCSDCKRMLCKDCIGKPTHGLSVLCSVCKNRRILRLQTLDYESILHYGVGGDREEDYVPTVAESELVKKSLQAAVNLSKPRKSVEFSGDMKRDIQSLGVTLPRNRASSLGVNRGQLKSIGKSASLETDSQAHSMSPENRSKSATLPKNETLSIPNINDADCGFQLMSKASDESLIDLCSVYSEQCYFGVEISGRILLGIWYKANEKRLYVRIIKAENLPEAADGALDPYVKTYLLPGVYKSNKRKTGLQYDTTKPVWNEILKYADLTQEEVCSRTLWVSVWDWNKYGRQQFLGEVRIPLTGRDLTNSRDEWFKLQDSEAKPSLGIEEVDSPEQPVKPRLLVAIMFKSYSEEERAHLRSEKEGIIGCLHIRIKKAENLPAMDVNDRTDSFARCFLFPNLQLGGKKKTKIVDNSLNPVWDEELAYTYLSLEELQCNRVLEVTLWDYDRRGTNQFIGGVRIGPNPFDVIHSHDWIDSTESESNHWEDMLDQPGEWVEAWHTLRPSMESMHKLQSNRKIREGSISSGSLPYETPLLSGQESPIISSPVPEGDKSLEVNISRSKKGHYQISGEILIGIKYKDESLYLKIIKAAGLTAVHRNGVSNPYVKMYLLPDRSKESKKKTDIKKKTLDPVYKEVFKYKVDKDKIHLRTLWVTVWDHGSLGGSHFMGETCISLNGDLRHSSERWYELHDFAETGMVVMATPFGRTPTHNPTGIPSLDSSALNAVEGENQQQQDPADHREGEGERPLDSSTPKPSSQEQEDVPTPKPSSLEQEDVPDTAPQDMPAIPIVNVEDFEAL